MEFELINSVQNIESHLSMDVDDRFYKETGLAGKLATLVAPALTNLGYRLVRVKVSGNAGKTLQIMAERSDGSMTIDDCEALSRHLSPFLDVHDLLSESYRLEISSPGIDRPLVRVSDIEIWAGHQVKVELKEPFDRQRRFKGRLEGYENSELRLHVDLGPLEHKMLGIPLDLIAEARLVLTDELVREAFARSKKYGSTGYADGMESPVLEMKDK
ncbi:MAG: ribosome maturation factor RimP [Hyphomicrobium sp.]